MSADSPVIVVGAGLSGLAAAETLAATHRVTLVERLPATGGVWGFDHPRVIELERSCLRLAVEFVVGATALRWRDNRLLVVGPGRTRWLPAERLVFAGGTRPGTAAELGIVGSRLSGMFAATVAHHLTDAKILLGRRPVVAGGGDWAEVVIPELLERSRVTVVGDDVAELSQRWPQISCWPAYRVAEVHGDERVQHVLVLDQRGTTCRISCDALVLAGNLRAIRNVDGANLNTAAATTFVQPTRSGLSADAVIDHARSTVCGVLSGIGGLQ